MLETVHGVIPYAGVALFGGIAFFALVGSPRHPTADRIGTVLEGVQLLLMAVTAVIGLVILATGGRPKDALHLLYGASILVVVPLVDLFTLGRPARQRSILRALAALAGIGLIARSFATG